MSTRSRKKDDKPTLEGRPPAGTTTERREASFAGGVSFSQSYHGAHESHVDAYDADAPFESEAWAKKLSRQRSFADSALPQLHERARAAKSVLQEMDAYDEEREENFADMSAHVDEMSGFVDDFVERKEEEIEKFQEMFDADGNLIERLDEDGNVILPTDEDGYAMDASAAKKKTYSVTFKLDQMLITEGWIWKKGSGDGMLGRRVWTKRYFKMDMSKPWHVYMYRKPPPPIEPRDAEGGESVEQYKRRKARTLRSERIHARARLDLENAEVFIPYQSRRHKNRRVKSELEFDVVQAKGARTFQMYTDTEAEMERWVRTLEYVINMVADARAANKKSKAGLSREARMQLDEAKRDAARACGVFGKGIFEATAGQTAEFVIQASDELGRPDDQGGRDFVVVLESRDLHYDLEVRDNDDGTYLVKYVPTRVGTYELSVLLDDYDVAGSPFHPTVAPAPVSAPNCVAEGAGLYCAVAGVVNEFVVRTRNSFNQEVDAAGVPFVVRCRNGDASECVRVLETQDVGGGVYVMRYALELSGAALSRVERGESVSCVLEVLLDDGIFSPSFERHIKGSPFCAVVAASADGPALAAAAKRAAANMSLGAQASLLNHFAGLQAVHPVAQPQRIAAAPAPAARRAPYDSPPQRNEVSFASTSPSAPQYLPFGAQELPHAREAAAAKRRGDSVELERAALAREREELQRLRRELECERRTVESETSRMSAVGASTREAVDDLADRARVLGGAGVQVGVCARTHSFLSVCFLRRTAHGESAHTARGAARRGNGAPGEHSLF